MLTKRTNILFDEELWNLLVTLAVKQKTSVGDLVRSAARKVYDADQKHHLDNEREKKFAKSVFSKGSCGLQRAHKLWQKILIRHLL